MDANVVATEAGALVELQCTAEGAPVARAQVDGLVDLALGGIASLVAAQKAALAAAGVDLAALHR